MTGEDVRLTIDTSGSNLATGKTSAAVADSGLQGTSESDMHLEKQAWFENAVREKLDLPIGYVKVAVLVVRWHEEVDEWPAEHSEEVR